jgi:hypothetical protein
LLKANAKKLAASPTGLTAEEDSLLSELTGALSNEAGKQVRKKAIDWLLQAVHSWPSALQFPLQGVLRLAVLRPELQNVLFQDQAQATKLLQRLLALLPSEDNDGKSAEVAPANAQALTLTTLANLLSLPTSASAEASCLQATQLANNPRLWSALRATATSETVTVRLMSSSAMFNAVLYLPPGSESDIAVEAATFLASRAEVEAASDVVARLLLSLAELLVGGGSSGRVELAQLLVGIGFLEAALPSITHKHANDPQTKLTAGELHTILSAAQQSQ